MTNKGNRSPVVLIASISDAHSRFPGLFMNTCLWYFENTALELPAIPIIYPFLSILYVSLSRVPSSVWIDWYRFNQSCIICWFWARNWSWSRVLMYLTCNFGWLLKYPETQFLASSLWLPLACNSPKAVSWNWATQGGNSHDWISNTQFLMDSSSSGINLCFEIPYNTGREDHLSYNTTFLLIPHKRRLLA